MNDVFLEIDETDLQGNYGTVCIRKDYIVAIAQDDETGNTNFLVLGDNSPHFTTIPYDKFMKQFMVIKMEDKK